MKNNSIIKPLTVGAVFVILVTFLIYYSTQSTDSKQNKGYSSVFSSVDWILGTWENREDSLIFQEEWKVQDRNILSGDGYLIKGEDTIFHENLSMILLNDQILYITQFKGQEPVMFNLISSEGEYLVFENKEHIYPSKITYNLVNDTTMVAGLEGKNEFGEFIKREFQYYRTEK